MSETTQLTEYVIKSGQGLLHGVSNDQEQKGKTLTLSDGDITLCILPLDEAFPDRFFKWVRDERIEIEPEEADSLEQHTIEVEPGVVLDVQFTGELKVKTDGEDIKFYWF